MHAPQLPNGRTNPHSFAALLVAALDAAKVSQDDIGKAVGAARPTVNKWTTGKDRPNLSTCDEIANHLGLGDEQRANLRLALAWSRVRPDEQQAIGAEFARVANERDAALAEAAQLRAEHERRLDTPEVHAAIDAALQNKLATRADVAEALLLIEVHKLADTWVGGEAAVVEGVLALLATASARANDGAARFAQVLLSFRGLDDLLVRNAILQAFEAATHGANNAALIYSKRAFDYADRSRPDFETLIPELDEWDETFDSPHNVPRVKMPEDELLGKASTIAKERLRFLMSRIGRAATAAAKLGAAAWTQPTPAVPVPSARGSRSKPGSE